ncbi:MAG: DUF1697 domain-containing protein [Clostridia bacterium]|nr:DUF1697 domain-containing protein [Clostridia bacterium]
MKSYVAFLRGINISGKNKVPMAELKTCFEKLGFSSVSTYLNSGNVSFDSDVDDVKKIRANIEKIISDSFGFTVPVFVAEKESVAELLCNAPAWWGSGDKSLYDNLIFILTDETPKEICDSIGPTSADLEKTEIVGNAIFWTFDRAAYQKCAWWKRTAQAGIAEKLTIRTANTIKKICK